MEIAFYLGFMVIVLVVGIGIDYLGYQGRQDKMNSWQSLAAAKKLTFIPGTWSPFGSGNASVHGIYRGCYLMLTVVQKNRNKSSTVYTEVSVRPEKRMIGQVNSDKFPLGRQLDYHDLKSWLKGQSSLYLGGKLSVLVVNGRQSFNYEEHKVITDNNFLEKLFDFLVELTHTCPEVLALGGEAIPVLQQMASESSEELQVVAQHLLYDIANDTTRRIQKASKELICPNCLTYCASYDLRLDWWSSLTFYGCRTCRQSREFLKASLIAVLDSQTEAEMETKRIEWQERVRVNWLRRRSLFDFSWVEIVQASDEEVERFAVQVGNDTDEWRKPRYEKMPCFVSAQCQLSQNTLRILERIFGEVRVEKLS